MTSFLKKLVKLKPFFFLMSFIFVLNGYATDGLEWQKIDLENRIKSHYSSNLRGLLSPSEFTVSVKVSYNDPGMPQFQDLNRTEVKVSDIEFDDSKGDYIAFSKVGLEVPVLESFYKKNQNQLQELYRYKESFDLFKNITEIEVNIALSADLSDLKKKAARNIVELSPFPISNIEIKVAVNEKAIEGDLKIQANEMRANSGTSMLLDFIGKFGNAIGMILAVLLFGILANKLVNTYFKLLAGLKKSSDTEESSKKSEQELSGDIAGGGGGGSRGAGAEQFSEFGISHFERFEKLLDFSFDQGGLLVKKWIKQPNKENILALRGAAQQLSQEMLQKIHNILTVEQRETWLGCIEDLLDDKELKKANQIISSEVIKEIITGATIDDYEIIDLIISLDTLTAKNFIFNDIENGTILLNLLNSSMASKIIDTMGAEEAAQVIDKAISVQMPSTPEGFEKFKGALKAAVQEGIESAFNNKMIQMIPNVNTEKEQILYHFLLKNGRRSTLFQTAQRFFPSELIFELPESFLKIVFKNYPLKNVVNLIVTSENADQRQWLTSMIAPEGTPARDVLEIEINSVQSDENQVKKLMKMRTEITKQFVDFVRGCIKADEEFKADIDITIQKWIDRTTQDHGTA